MDRMRYSQTSTKIVTQPESTASMGVGVGGASYQKTHSALVNRLLAETDRLSGGRAGWLQRFISYGFIGGFAAIVNLAVFSLIFYSVKSPLGTGAAAHSIWYVIVFAIAAEISTVTNFVINDRITFRHLPGHVRSWWVRCLRFHVTSLLGTLLTLVISYTLAQAGLTAALAEAIAIAVAFFFNFVMHHIFTYRTADQYTPPNGLHMTTADTLPIFPEMRTLAKAMGYRDALDENELVEQEPPASFPDAYGSRAPRNPIAEDNW